MTFISQIKGNALYSLHAFYVMKDTSRMLNPCLNGAIE